MLKFPLNPNTNLVDNFKKFIGREALTSLLFCNSLFIPLHFGICLMLIVLSLVSLDLDDVFTLLPPHLHLTTSKVMVIVWRLRANIIRTVLYIANVLPLQWAQLTKTVHTARLGLEFVFCVF